MQYEFQTRGLSVGYDGRTLIRNIDLDVEKGEIITLIGPNGSGKSTILKSIVKQLKLLGGTVFIGREDLKSLSYKALSTRIAVVLTERIRPELMSCRDIVATGRYPYTGTLGRLTPADEEKVRAAMQTVHIEALAERDFANLSDGQRQRVLLARAICQEPEIIVLDEPTSYLDIRHKLELLGVLRRMAKEKGITVIMSLHEIDLAQKISDRVICVRGETIARFGSPEEIFRDELVRELYDVREGSYNALLGSVELARPEGAPQVFVISGAGSGIGPFRRLQKENIPFAAGILYENDVDYQIARALAVRIVGEKPFMPISETAIREAMEVMNACPRVLLTAVPIGETNRRLEELIRAAEAQGKLERDEAGAAKPGRGLY